MYLKNLTYVLLCSLMFFQVGCKRNKLQKSIAEIPKSEIDTVDSLQIEEVLNFEIIESDFDYLKLKSKIDLQSEAISQSFPANVHIQKDSVIWISVSVGIEAARCLITQDSILCLDRINRTYYSLSIEDLSTQFNFDFDFKLLQALLVGNLPLDRKPGDRIEPNSLYTSLFQNANNISIENQIDNVTHKLNTILAEDVQGKSKLGISYADFIPLLTGQLVPHSIFTKIDVLKGDEIKTTTLEFKHTKFEFTDQKLRFPYSVPKSYTKGEIVF
ncbi:DUF4292 domain-containing protein [Jiulongibacter sediminis]|uniref:Deoxyuridine 5'-triphosphate nucleotidohydrolase n=1 Tax=Jiulongibacter sediminis TaxID=1605367 RepID=A0A0P7BMZ8_9BACT|nr:DUF4292 domain-containing protein [Jiulongibacter sediminis]KPM48626.1 hypothetical protein AFM12_08435 [Jiulongibacter sediminis]TBX25164.1 hypothetical protein TK44_08440 [Jiulongibacter sediminis]